MSNAEKEKKKCALYQHNLAKYVGCSKSQFLPNSHKGKVEYDRAKRENNYLKNKITEFQKMHAGVTVRSDTKIDQSTYPTSIVFWPNMPYPRDNNGVKKTLDKDDRENFFQDECKLYSQPMHASTSMQCAMVFRSKMTHASVPLKKGWRVALQLQFTPNKLGFYPSEKVPECILAGIPINHVGDQNPLVVLLRHNIKRLLRNVCSTNNGCDAFAHKSGYIAFFVNIEVPPNFQIEEGKSLEHDQPSKAFLKCLEWEDGNRKRDTTTSGTLSKLMIEQYHLSSENPAALTDLRLLFVSPLSVFEIHDDVEHLSTSNDAITIHMNIFTSHDYQPGDQDMGPWTLEDDKHTMEQMNHDIVHKMVQWRQMEQMRHDVAEEKPKLQLWQGNFGMAECFFNPNEGEFETSKANKGKKRRGKGKQYEGNEIKDEENNVEPKKKSKKKKHLNYDVEPNKKSKKKKDPNAPNRAKTLETKKKSKKKKNPNAPKRAKTSYTFFMMENRPAIKKDNAGATFGELVRHLI